MDENSDFVFKILLLGDTLTGKTALLLRYVDNSFSFSNHYATIGIDNREKLIVFDMYKIKLQIWDTPGVERFRTLLIHVYKGTDGFIFNFNITNKGALKDIDYFIKNAKEEKKNNYDSIICANFFDLKEERKFTDEEIKNY